MKSPKFFALGCAAASLVLSSLTGCATSQTASGTAKHVKNVDLLFVQNASGLSTGKGKITLRGVNAQTICFSDRPDRVAGHMTTAKFVPMWSQGKDSFLKDPPNATLSVFHGSAVESAVVTLRNPRLSGDDLSYDVTVLEGSLPKHSGSCSLFIDVIGMPLTPRSYAGVARRTWRGAAFAGPYVPPAVYAPTVVHYGPYGTTVIRRW